MVFYGTRDCASSVRQYQSNCSFSWATCFEGTALKRGWDHWRQVVHDVVDNPFFEWTILLLIFASRHVLSGSDRQTGIIGSLRLLSYNYGGKGMRICMV